MQFTTATWLNKSDILTKAKVGQIEIGVTDGPNPEDLLSQKLHLLEDKSNDFWDKAVRQMATEKVTPRCFFIFCR